MSVIVMKFGGSCIMDAEAVKNAARIITAEYKKGNSVAIGKYDNVTLYPTITMQKIPSLYEKCDIYLDVNKENEIVQAVNRAFLSNLVIFAFDETIHNINYIAKDNRYKADDYSKLIEDINNICYDTNKWNKRLKLQRNHALSEEKERYANI